MTDLSFYPDAHRATALDKRMMRELARSLAQLRTQIEAQTSPSESALHAHKLNTVISALDGQERISPAVFAGYYQLVFSLLNEEENYPEKLDDLVSVIEHRQGLSFRDFSVAGLGSDKLVSLYTACLDTDERAGFAFLPPGNAQSRQTRASVLRALELMQTTVPAMAAEFTSIVNEVILAAAPKEPGAFRFDGASSYMLWGALILSVDDEKSDLEMMETLAHESAHSFLFGLMIEEPLVYNDDDELFDSPLRRDPRPMDGIYHATFVSARMHYAMNEARQSGLLNETQQQECVNYLAASKKAFFDGHGVVVQKGSLSPGGQEIMENAHRYMQDHAYV